MHTYFDQLSLISGHWQPPPDPASPIWEQAFDGALPEHRTKIADSWLWLINNELAKQDYRTSLFSWITNYESAYRKLGSFVTPELFAEARLKGGFDELVDTRFQSIWAGVTDERRNEFAKYLKGCWFDPKADKVANFESIISMFTNATKEELIKFKTALPLLCKISWGEAENAPEDTKDARLEIAIKISCLCAFNATGGETLPPVPDRNKTGMNWFKFTNGIQSNAGYHSRAEQRPEVLETVRNTPPRVALNILSDMLHYVVAQKEDGQTVLITSTFFNPTDKVSDDVYGALRTWLPSYTKQWDIAESLGVTYQEAVAMARASEPEVETKAQLPHDILVNLN